MPAAGNRERSLASEIVNKLEAAADEISRLVEFRGDDEDEEGEETLGEAQNLAYDSAQYLRDFYIAL